MKRKKAAPSYPISLRIPPAELLLVRSAAFAERKNLSEWIRTVAVERADELRCPDGPPLDGFVSDDQQVNAVQATIATPRRRVDP